MEDRYGTVEYKCPLLIALELTPVEACKHVKGKLKTKNQNKAKSQLSLSRSVGYSK